MEIGPERPQEIAAIAALHQAAFGDVYEAAVVDGLRSGGWAFASLVAREAGRVVGHVMFSDMQVVVDGQKVRAAALAPLSVAASHRRAGVGAALVRAGIAAARAHGSAAVLVLGDPAYYRRFGFSAESIAHLCTPYPPGKLMGLELQPGSLAGAAGEVGYPAPFTRAQVDKGR